MLRRLATRSFGFLPKDVVIVSAQRTPIGSFMGSLSTVPATKLGANAIRAALQKINLDPKEVNEVIMGHVLQAGCGQAPTRQATLYAGLPQETICTGVNKVCSSGIKAVVYAAQSIALGVSDVIVAGGMESMSLAPFLLPNYRSGQLMGDGVLYDSITYDGLNCPFNKVLMGACTEKTIIKYGLTREEQDKFCIDSYKRAADAWARGFFKTEVTPVEVEGKKGVVFVDEDEEFRKVKFEKIPSLKPVFDKNGSITAANASSINDGACALVVMSADKAKKLGYKPLAKILSFADSETEPTHFGIAPAEAIKKTIERAGLTKERVDLFEINEAFSAVVVANMKLLELDHSKVNVNGGAVSLGHPLGMSGARLISTLIYALKEKNKSIGVMGICNGGGGATSMAIELV
ncbi:unnamed protein product [Blepharisma stoltei]|uniref:acetyl-CoA C-acetyltransferase n=1 Tax=Blepharisma stoltei TaxID=1481888 RepID=A0AAU9K5E6_9CILI|nr:unnamed protein product [Blepharisma stoltei]